jgi:hypothetical protein
MDTLEVNGHFLSTYLSSFAAAGVLNPNPTFLKYLLALVLSFSNFFVLRKTACYF